MINRVMLKQPVLLEMISIVIIIILSTLVIINNNMLIQ